MKSDLVLRELRQEDVFIITEAFKKQGWNKPFSQYENYLKFQETGERDIIVGVLDGEFAGYLTIKWESDYLPFKEKEIPEIVDLNVLKKFQRKGIGVVLMDEAEERIKRKSTLAGIGFGVYKDYGPAQILYAKRKYIPDGRGLMKNFRSLEYGEEVKIDDDLALYLIKEL